MIKPEVGKVGLLVNWFESLDYKNEILPTCTRHRSPFSTCEKCIDVCPQHAIELVNNKPVIDEGKCDQCGQCISTCPVQAIQGIIPIRDLFQNQLLMTKDHLPTVKEMLVLYKHGIRGLIGEELVISDEWQQIIGETNSILKQLGEEELSVSNTPLEMKEQCYSRRELFSLWGKESKSLLKQITPAKWRFNQNKLELAQYYQDYQFVQISIDSNTCTLCKACEILCSKNCLKISETGFELTLQSCSSCLLCADICPEKSITLLEQITPIHNIHLPIYIKQCHVCHKKFKTLREHDEKCVVCTKTEGYLSSH